MTLSSHDYATELYTCGVFYTFKMKDLVKPKHTWNKLEGKCVELDPRCYRNSKTAGTCVCDWGYIL